MNELRIETRSIINVGFQSCFDWPELRFESSDTKLSVQVAVPRLAEVQNMITELKGVHERRLTDVPIARIVESFDEVVKCWMRPDYYLRQMSEEMLPLITGFSRSMISMLIDNIFRELTGEALWRLLLEELGDPLVLDGFKARRAAQGLTRAYGPEVLVNILGGGNPFVAALDIAYALLCKSACITRVSSNEPLFAALFAHSIAEIDRELGRGLIVCWWPVEANEIGCEIFKWADCIAVSGTDTTVKAVAAMVPERCRLITHGHSIEIALIGREALNTGRTEELARHASLDISLANQLTCLSPQVIYVEEGGEVSPEQFAELLAGELLHQQAALPRGNVSREDLLSFRRVKTRYQFRQYQSESRISVLGLDSSSEWLVIYDPNPLLIPGPGYRLIRVCPIEDLNVAMTMVHRNRPLVSTVGLAVGDERLVALAEQLGESGVSRLCRIGDMLKPPLTWHHDGSFHLLPLLKWTDLELSI